MFLVALICNFFFNIITRAIRFIEFVYNNVYFVQLFFGDNNFMKLLKSTSMLGIFGYINEIGCVHFLFNIKARFKQYRLI